MVGLVWYVFIGTSVRVTPTSVWGGKLKIMPFLAVVATFVPTRLTPGTVVTGVARGLNSFIAEPFFLSSNIVLLKTAIARAVKLTYATQRTSSKFIILAHYFTKFTSERFPQSQSRGISVHTNLHGGLVSDIY